MGAARGGVGFGGACFFCGGGERFGAGLETRATGCAFGAGAGVGAGAGLEPPNKLNGLDAGAFLGSGFATAALGAGFCREKTGFFGAGVGAGAGCFFGCGAGFGREKSGFFGAGVGAGAGTSTSALGLEPPKKENLGAALAGAGVGVGAGFTAARAGLDTGRGVGRGAGLDTARVATGFGAGVWAGATGRGVRERGDPARPDREKPGPDEVPDAEEPVLALDERGPVPDVNRLRPDEARAGAGEGGAALPVPKIDWIGDGPFGAGTRRGAGGSGIRTGAGVGCCRAGRGGLETERGAGALLGAGAGAGLGVLELPKMDGRPKDGALVLGAAFFGGSDVFVDALGAAPKEKGRPGRAGAGVGVGAGFDAFGAAGLGAMEPSENFGSDGAFGAGDGAFFAGFAAALGSSVSFAAPPSEMDGREGRENGVALSSLLASSLRFTSLKKNLGLSSFVSSSLESSLLIRFFPGGRSILVTGAGVGAFALGAEDLLSPLNNESNPPNAGTLGAAGFSTLAGAA